MVFECGELYLAPSQVKMFVFQERSDLLRNELEEWKSIAVCDC